MSELICEQCQRPITDPWAAISVPGITVPGQDPQQHVTCPPGTCANCKTVMPYADLIRVELADGELWDDPDMLVCANVPKCQVRAGELDPDDVPLDAR
jgi:hypothetical protein